MGCARSGEGVWQFGAGVGEKLAPFQRIRQCGVSEKGEWGFLFLWKNWSSWWLETGQSLYFAKVKGIQLGWRGSSRN